MAKAQQQTGRQEVLLTRVFDAPRSLVFKAWTDPAQMAQWWGPQGFTNPMCRLDARPGGSIRIDMRGPDGRVYPMSGTFQKILAPAKLVFTAVAEDAGGQPILESLTTVTFTEAGGQTTVTVQASAIGFTSDAPGMLAGMHAGWSQSLERLAVSLAGTAGTP